MKLINPDYLMDIIINEPEAYGYVCAYDIRNTPTIDTDDFNRRTMSQLAEKTKMLDNWIQQKCTQCKFFKKREGETKVRPLYKSRNNKRNS